MHTSFAPLSVCIVTNNWHPKLEEIIHTFSNKVDEVLIGYDGDMSTLPVHLQFDFLKLVTVQWEGYSITKNKLAANAKNDWILSIDSDEVPDETLVNSICSLPYSELSIQNQYKLKRQSYFEGKKMRHGSWGNDSVVRLYNRNTTKWNNSLVHENLEQNSETKIITLKGILAHYTAEDYETFLAKSLHYAKLSAEKYYQHKKKATFVKCYLSPVFSFIKEYIFQTGFADGQRGLKIAVGNAKYTYWKYKFLKENKTK